MRVAFALVVAGCGLAAGGTAAQSATADAATRGRCERHVHHAVTRSGAALVFARTSKDGGTVRLYACSRPSGAPRLLATTEPDDGYYGSDAFFTSLRATGPYVAGELVLGSAGAAQCTKYAADPCPVPEHRVRVLAVGSGRRLDLAVAPLAAPVLVSADGVLAWLTGGAGDLHLSAAATTPAAARGRLAATPAELDHGAIDAASVRLRGHTLTWTTGGAARMARVGG